MKKHNLGYKFRVYPNCEQQEKINHIFGCSRFYFNLVCDLHTRIFKPEEYK